MRDETFVQKVLVILLCLAVALPAAAMAVSQDASAETGDLHTLNIMTWAEGDNPDDQSSFTQQAASQTEAEGDPYTVPADPAIPGGYDFVGWYAMGATDAFDFDAGITGDLTIYAKFERDWANTVQVNSLSGLKTQILSAADGTPKSIELTADIAFDSTPDRIEIPANKIIRISSATGATFTIDASTYAIAILVEEDGMLYLQDIRITGGYAPGYLPSGVGAGILNNGTLIMGSGTEITANDANYGGGGVGNDDGAVFIMNGGVISENTADYGAVYNDDGAVFIMNGGEISENNSDYASGVYNYRGTFIMNGGEISGNEAVNEGGGVYNADISTFTMNGGEISGNSAYIGAGVENSGTFTMNGGEISGNNANSSGGGVYSAHLFTMNGGEISSNSAYSGAGVDNTSTFTMNGGEISGNTAQNGAGVGNTGVFTMYGGVISDNDAPRAAGVCNFLTFTMYGGKISGNESSLIGAGVENVNTFTMNDGEISGNVADLDGGGVYSTGTFTMNDGEISGNSAVNGNGGGVQNNQGTFTMNDGEISGNSAVNGNGGGISNIDVLVMKGGIISDNGAMRGAGVYNAGTFTMNDGEISGNESFFGAGVDNESIFAMNNGKISGNKANLEGGGVYSAHLFTMNDGEISGNEATRGGGAATTGTFTMNDGEISGNKATNGGGVFNYDEFTMNDGEISGNEAVQNGGGIWMEDLSKLMVGSSATFSDNEASAWYERLSADDSLYDNNIAVADTGWTSMFDQGYNNYDIGYIKGYRVIFILNHDYTDETSVSKEAVPCGNTLGAQIPEDPVREGYEFQGWNVQRDGTGATYTDSSPTVTANIELYALWELKGGYTVQYDLDGGNADPAVSDLINVLWTDANLMPSGTFTKGGYTFAGWKLVDRDGTAVTPSESVPPGSTYGGLAADDTVMSVTLQAQWVLSPVAADYTVTYDGNGSTSGTVPTDRGSYTGGSAVTVMGSGSLAKTGYAFAGWSAYPNASSPAYGEGDTFTIYYSITLYAVWESEDGIYTVTFVDWDNTILKTEQVPFGGSATEPAHPTRLGHTFTGWDVPFDNIIYDLTVKAQYDEDLSPASGDSDWAVLNLVLALIGVIIAIFAVVRIVRKDDDGEEGKKARSLLWAAVAIFAAVVGIVFFLFTEDMSNTMAFVDKWTLVNMAVMAVTAIAAALVLREEEGLEYNR